MKARKIAALLLAAAVLLTACKKEKPAEVSSAPEPAPPVEEEKDPNWPAKIGTIVLEEKPEVIISLSPALTELAYELEQPLSGVSTFCDYPEKVSELDRFGTADQPDVEALEKANANLLLSSVPLTSSVQEALEKAEIPVLVLPRVDSIEAMEDIYIDLATAFYGVIDGPDKGEAVYSPLKERYDALVSAAGGASPDADSASSEAAPAGNAATDKKISGIWLRATPLLMATGDTFEGRLLEQALGVKNDAADYTHWQYPQDKAVDLYPDVLFYDVSIPVDYFASTQVYSTTDAFKQKRMYPFQAIAFERQSARMLDELENMAEMLKAGAYEALPAAEPEPAA